MFSQTAGDISRLPCSRLVNEGLSVSISVSLYIIMFVCMGVLLPVCVCWSVCRRVYVARLKVYAYLLSVVEHQSIKLQRFSKLMTLSA